MSSANGATLYDLGFAMAGVGCVLKRHAMLSSRHALGVGAFAWISADSPQQCPLSNTLPSSCGEFVEGQTTLLTGSKNDMMRLVRHRETCESLTSGFRTACQAANLKRFFFSKKQNRLRTKCPEACHTECLNLSLSNGHSSSGNF